MENKLKLTKRELSEIHLAMSYAENFHHGTAGHNGYMVLAKVMAFQGFVLEFDGTLTYPDFVVIVEEPGRV